MRAARWPLLACVLLAIGCSSDEPKRGAPPPTFTPADASSTGAMVFLRAKPSSGSDLGIDVVAHGIPRGVHGAAFRLRWDPTKLAWSGAERSASWSKEALALAKEGAPGELVLVWTEKGGSPPVNATDETVLGTLDFARKPAAGASLEFRTDRSTLRDADGQAIPVEWRGGTLGGP